MVTSQLHAGRAWDRKSSPTNCATQPTFTTLRANFCGAITFDQKHYSKVYTAHLEINIRGRSVNKW